MKVKAVLWAVTLFAGMMMFVACAGQKGPAELALKSAEEAINATRAEAEKYVPDQMAGLDSTLAAVKEKLAKGEYKAVVTEAQSLAAQAKNVLDAAMAKKDELKKNWEELSQGIPGMLAAIQGKVDRLSKSIKLPADLSAEKFEQAKASFAGVKEEWTKALENFKTGNFAEAVSMANSVKAKATETMGLLGITTASAGTKT